MGEYPRIHLRMFAAILLLVTVVLAIYAQTWRFEFLLWDDQMYVTGTPEVFTGLKAENLLWAFQTRYFGLWNPLTWISLMADASLWGPNPGGFHLTSVVIHAAAAVALFLFLAYATGAFWRPLVVSLLFAIHPLQVESVSWISGRKDVLLALFFFLTLLFHTLWAKTGKPAMLVLVYLTALMAGMSKPMAVTLPVAMVIADMWPLKRLGFPAAFWRPLGQSIAEKWPLFVAALILTAVHLWAPAQSGLQAVREHQVLDVVTRLQVAAAAYGTFLWKMLWPVEQSYFHPLFLPLPMAQYLVPPLLLGAVLHIGWHLRVSHPFVLAGLAWYCLVLFPVSGIVQISAHGYAYADRYGYLPLVGIYIVLLWVLPDSLAKKPGRIPLALVAASISIPLAMLAHWQAGHWKDSVSLYQRALEIEPRNRMAELGLGYALVRKGELDRARGHFQRVIQGHAPDIQSAQAQYGLGSIASMQGDTPGALEAWRLAATMDDTYIYPPLSLGKHALQSGQLQEAIGHFEEANRRSPSDVEVLNNLGVAYARLGHHEQALQAYRRAVESDGNNRIAKLNLARTYEKLGQRQAAIETYSSLLRHNPDDPVALSGLQRLR